MELCKVRFDGSHHIASPYKNVSDFTTEEIIEKENEALGLSSSNSKKEFFVNEWAEKNFPYHGKKKVDEKHVPLKMYLKQLYSIYNKSISKEAELIEALYDNIYYDSNYEDLYDFDNEDDLKKLRAYIFNFVYKEKENLKARKQLFRRKALNNDWNYFVTFTYDDKKHNEDSFVKVLKKKLQNLHTNYGWLYMGCFERSKTERLHFHGLVWVPEGAMKSNIREVSYFDTTSHKKAVSFINEEFESKIGRNDFKPITKLDLTFTNSLDYILKYIGKENEKIVYSRGIKDSVMALVDIKNNVICKLNEDSCYYILADESNIKEVSKDYSLLSH